MLVNTLTVLSLMATLGATFRFPANTADGVYSIYEDVNGTEVFQFIGSANQEITDPASRVLRALFRRGQTWCGCTVGMDHDDTDKAFSALQKAVGDNGQTVHSGEKIASTKGSSVAFMCNYDGSDTTARKGEVIMGAGTVTSACGTYIAGTTQLDGHPHLDFGYMLKTNDFCNTAEGSPIHHC